MYHLHFYGSIFSELFRIARCTLRINYFIPRAFYLFSRIITQGGNRATVTKKLKKAFQSYSTAKTHDEINLLKLMMK